LSSLEWETPQLFFDELNREFNFTIDVCATNKNAKLSRFISPEMNALNYIWSGICWMNPPYDRNIGLWIAKTWQAAQSGVTVVALLQGRSTDTIWFHDYIMKASEIRFIKDRLSFGLDGKFSRANISNMIVVFRPFCQGPPIVSSIDNKGKSILNSCAQKALL